MDEHLILRNRLKTVRKEKKLSQTELAELVGVSRNTISSIETPLQPPDNLPRAFRLIKPALLSVQRRL